MPLRDDLLTPIAGDNPAGADLRYDPVYDKLKEARRQDDDLPQGDWATDRKTADYALVVKLAGDLLATKTKDLQVAVWLTEALLKREGYAGYASGLGLLRELITQYWDTLHPELEDGDAELRAGPLEWVAAKLDLALRQVPLTREGHDYLAYVESRAIPTEEQAEDDDEKAKVRRAALEDGKTTPEDFDKGFAETGKPFYKQLAADLAAALDAVGTLDEASQERFADLAPSFRRTRETLEEVQRTVKLLLGQKLALDPDPIEEVPVEIAAGDGAAGDAPAAAGGVAMGPTGGILPAEPSGAEDAAARVVSAARWLRQKEPGNPASYLLLRGLRWGELRAAPVGAAPEPRLLVAPPTPVRAQLKGLLLDAKWRELLELAETVMGTPAGRGWLDLQRYALTACDNLGAEYAPVAAAVRTALGALVRDFPQLVEMTLMDDTPTANAETQEWLAEEGIGGDAAAEGDASAAEPAVDEGEAALAEEGDGAATGGGIPAAPRPRGLAWSPYERAMAEVRAGRPQRGIELLMQEVARERSKRGRFVRRTQVARIMVENGLDAVAFPILEQLLQQLEEHKLEEWESGELAAQPLALMWRCLDRTGRDDSMKEELYLRICRLDPVQAMKLGSA